MDSSDPISLFRQLCKTPGMYISSNRYEAVAAFMNGYDMARGGSALTGFREYLLCQCDSWNNLPWWLLVRSVSGTAGSDLSKPVHDKADAQLVTALAMHLERFSERLASGGMARIYWEYAQWLSSRPHDDNEAHRLFLRISRQER